jgi:hypothetical protein
LYLIQFSFLINAIDEEEIQPAPPSVTSDENDIHFPKSAALSDSEDTSSPQKHDSQSDEDSSSGDEHESVFGYGDQLVTTTDSPNRILRKPRFSYAPILDPMLPSIEGSHVMTAYLNSSFNVQSNIEIFVGQKLVDQLLNTDMLHAFIDKFSGYQLPIKSIEMFLGSPQLFRWITSHFEVLKWLGMCNLKLSNLRIQKARLAPVATEETAKRVVTLMDDRIRVAITGVALIITLDYHLTGTDGGLIRENMVKTNGSMWIRITDSSITLDVKPTFDPERRVPVLKVFQDERSQSVFREGKISIRFDQTVGISFLNAMAYIVHKMFGGKLARAIINVATDELDTISGTLNLRLYGLLMSTINVMFDEWGVASPKMPELIALNFGWEVKQRRFIVSTRFVAIKREGREILENAVEELSRFSYEMEKLPSKRRAALIWNFKQHLKRFKSRTKQALRPKKSAPIDAAAKPQIFNQPEP